ncbi:MAG: serine/threonine-protein kinase [Pseudomonadota bacterium]
MSESDSNASDRARRILQRLAETSDSLHESTTGSDHDQVAHRLEQIEQLFMLHGGERRGPSSPTPQQIVFEWGHLQALSVLSEGSFGQVFRAYDPILDRDVALKLLKADHNRPFQSQLFLQEARQLALVRHRNVLAVHGAAIHDHRAGLWTDLIEGHTAHDANYQSHWTALEPTLDLIESMALGLKAVHAAGLIHGDIKPSNIMRDQAESWILMDFGASQNLELMDLSPSMTSGTPLYMAPEVVLGDAPSIESDLYSLGATLYRIVIGHAPVEARDWHELRDLHRTGASQPSVRGRGLDRRIADLIDPLLAHAPNDRLSLDRLLQRIRLIREAPQRRFRRIAFGSIAAVLVLGMGLTSMGFYQANEARILAEREQQNTTAVNRFLQRMLLSPSSSGRARDMTVEDMLIQAAADTDQALSGQPEAMVVVRRVLADSFNVLRRPALAKQQISSALDTIEFHSLLLPEEQQYLQLEDIRALEIEHRHDESIRLAEAFVDQHRQTLGDDHHFIQLARNYQVTNLLTQSRFEEAEALMNEHFSQIPPPDTADTHFGYEMLQSWANVHRGLGRNEAALNSAQRSLEWLDQYPRARPINRAHAMTNLALSYWNISQFDEALAVLNELQPLQIRIFGEASSDFISTLTNRSAVQFDAGDPAGAAETLQRALNLIEAHPGLIDVPEQLNVQSNLANIHTANGQLVQAEQLMRETRARSIEVLGPLHQNVLILEYNLAELLSNQARYSESAVLAEATLERMREGFGNEHWLTLLGQDNLAVALTGLGQFDQAFVLHDQALQPLADQLGSEHPYVLIVERHRLATSLKADPARVDRTAIEALTARHETVLGEDHPDTEKSRQLIRLKHP